MSQASGSRVGKVYLVGAGPGDPGLITVRGTECLAQADLVLHDYLVNPLLFAMPHRRRNGWPWDIPMGCARWGRKRSTAE